AAVRSLRRARERLLPRRFAARARRPGTAQGLRARRLRLARVERLLRARGRSDRPHRARGGGRCVLPAPRARACEHRGAVPRDPASRARGGRVTKRALITGVGGHDGSLLAELLLEHGYDVIGVMRRSAASYPNLAGITDRIELIQADLNDELALVRALRTFRPDEVYNLASVSFVPMSWEQPVLTAQLAAVGATALLEAVREVDPAIRFYQASSSEIFGEPLETPQTEQTPLAPLTPYGVAKAYAHFITR